MPGMTGSEVLGKVVQGYRMPMPRLDSANVPASFYDMMLSCWHKNADERPTFRYLYDFYDDYFVSVEPTYKEAGIVN